MGAATPGTKLGRYQVIKHLASGGMAEVLLARATGIEGFTRHVVIKRIRPGQADNAQFVQMFLNEARLAAQLHHHNIVQVHDIGQEGEEYFFAMEYVHGEDLRRLLTNVARRKEKVPLEHVVSIISACATALHHAHEQVGPDRKPLQIVHRDVSPANVLVGYDGNVKVVDFGIAKAALSTHEATVAGALKGKASYMAPEQCTGTGGIDRRTDVFALGIVLYELATARRLFKGENDFLTMSAIVAGSIPPARTHRPDLPEGLDAILMKALALSPNDRYQTADQMHDALEQFANSARVRPSTSGLAAYMKQQFGERAEPWLVEHDPNSELSVDFDGSASGMARPPPEALEGNAIPESVELAKSAPIMRARVKASTHAPPLASVSTQKMAKPRTPTRQVAIPGGPVATPGKPVRRPTASDVRPPGSPPPAPPTRRKAITVQIPVAQQAAGAGVAVPRATQSGGIPLPGMTMEGSATAHSGIPQDIDATWDPSRPMAAVDTASLIAAEQITKAAAETHLASGTGTGGASVSAAGAGGARTVNPLGAASSRSTITGTSAGDAGTSRSGASMATGPNGASGDGTKPSVTVAESEAESPTRTTATAATAIGATGAKSAATAPATSTSGAKPAAATASAKPAGAAAATSTSSVTGAGTSAQPAAATTFTSPAATSTKPSAAMSPTGGATTSGAATGGATTSGAAAAPTSAKASHASATGVKSPTSSAGVKSDPAIVVTPGGAAVAGPSTTTTLPTATSAASAATRTPSGTKSDPAIVTPAASASTTSVGAKSDPAIVTPKADGPNAPAAIAGSPTRSPAGTKSDPAIAVPRTTTPVGGTPGTTNAAPAIAAPAISRTATPVKGSPPLSASRAPLPGMSRGDATPAAARPLPGMAATPGSIASSTTTGATPGSGAAAAGPALPRTTTPTAGLGKNAADAVAAASADSEANSSGVLKPRLPAPLRNKPPTLAPLVGDTSSSKISNEATDATAGDNSTMAAPLDAQSPFGAADAPSPFSTAVDAPSPFAAPPAKDDARNDSDEAASPVVAAAAASPFAAPAASPFAAAPATAAADSLPGAPAKGTIAAALDAPAFAGMPPATDTDPWGTQPKTPGLVAKLLSSPKRMAIAGGAAVVLIAILVMAMSGGADKKQPASSAGPDKTAKSADTKQPGDDVEPTAVERGPAEPGSGEVPTAVENPAGSGDGSDSAEGPDDGSAAGSDAATNDGDAVGSAKPPPVKKPTKTPTKRVVKRPVKAPVKTAVKTPVKTVAKTTKPPTTTKSTKGAVQKTTKKCDPTALFPCKKKK